MLFELDIMKYICFREQSVQFSNFLVQFTCWLSSSVFSFQDVKKATELEAIMTKQKMKVDLKAEGGEF